ncbi:unnamed protein product [Heligmosomoides polygyrus]|uniref:Sterile domain-containing protein n=1 Tax=Heligmosomoides polygyrus TaxID=6339 RepID=A0A183GDU8_HELPZ|nr:unnamed protein product [Heligmosomoides polygyrus]
MEKMEKEVERKTPGELGRMVVGDLAYETIMDLPEERNMLLKAMDMMKKRQASMNDDRLYRKLNEVCPTRQLAPNKWQYIMKPVDMKWFFFHVPFFALPRKIFEKFAIPVKNFLTTQLFRFYVNKLLFKKPPPFPEDADLPEIFNAFGPNNRRKRKAGFPDLAAIKQDMVHHVTHFALMYCVHWVVEMLTLRNVNGMVKYAYPALDVLGKMVKVRSCHLISCRRHSWFWN